MKDSSESFGLFCVAVTVLAATTMAFTQPGNQEKLVKQKPDSRSNLRQLGVALRMYCQDYDDVLPPMKNVATVRSLLSPYLENESAFVSPDTGQPFHPNASLSGQPLKVVGKGSFRKKREIALFYEAKPKAHGARFVLVFPIADRIDENRQLWWSFTVDGVPIQSTVPPDFRVVSVSGRNWALMKSDSRIVADGMKAGSVKGAVSAH